MHLAVDAHNLLSDRRGIGVYLRAVVSRMLLREDLRVTLLLKEFLPQRFRGALASEFAGANGSDHPLRFGVATTVPRDADCVWHPWNGTFFAARGSSARPSGPPSVVTIHDVVPFAFPEQDERLRRSQQEPFLRSAQAGLLITDSDFSRKEIVRFLAVEESRIHVVPLAADGRFKPSPPSGLSANVFGKPYILYVGANDARKNLVTLVAAHRAAFPNGDVALVCVTRNAPEGTIELRDVSFEDLRGLYQEAIAFAMPSLYEGFGIPPLEAMRCGTPVVASRAASLPEVCGEAALYVDDPRNVNAWCDALQRISRDATQGPGDRGSLRSRLRAAGLKQAENFSWDITAHATLEILKTAAMTEGTR